MENGHIDEHGMCLEAFIDWGVLVPAKNVLLEEIMLRNTSVWLGTLFLSAEEVHPFQFVSGWFWLEVPQHRCFSVLSQVCL